MQAKSNLLFMYTHDDDDDAQCNEGDIYTCMFVFLVCGFEHAFF